MANEIGMDADQVRAFAAKIDSQAMLLSEVISVVNSLAGQLPHAWAGGDATEFVGWWTNQHRPALQRVLDSITGLATAARNNATAQDVVSGASGGASAGGHPGVTQTETSIEATRHSLSVSQKTSTTWTDQSDAQGTGHFGSAPVSGDAQAQAYAKVTEQSHAELSKDRLEADLGAGAGIGASAAASGMIGNKDLSADGDVKAQVDADAKAQAGATIGPDGADVKASGDLYAGAQASGQVSGQVDGVGVGVGGHAYAGIGVHADAEAQVSFEEAKVSVSVGAALGLGAGVNVSFDVKPAEVLHNISRFW